MGKEKFKSILKAVEDLSSYEWPLHGRTTCRQRFGNWTTQCRMTYRYRWCFSARHLGVWWQLLEKLITVIKQFISNKYGESIEVTWS